MSAASALVSEAIEIARAAVADGEGEGLPRLDELQAASGRVQSALGELAEKLDHRVARGPATQRELWRLLAELQQLERELIERRYVRRVDALERVKEALRSLGEVGSAAGILERSAEWLGENSDFERVLVSGVIDGRLQVESAWCRDDPGAAEALMRLLRDRPMRLDYPLLEAELTGRQGTAVVTRAEAGSRVDDGWSEALGWSSYAVAMLSLGGATTGLVHADCPVSGRAVDSIDEEVLGAYAQGLAQVFERAVLRGRLRAHRMHVLCSTWSG